MTSRLLWALCGIGPLVAVDQFTKFLIPRFLEASSFIPVTSFLNLVLVKNKGISFGLFPAGGTAGTLFLGTVAIAILIFLGVWYAKASHSRGTSLSLIFIMGGAIGNIIDRVSYGAVIDFLDFHVNSWHFPAFNVADSAITVGAVLMLLTQGFESPILGSSPDSKK